MKIKEIILFTNDIQGQKRFYNGLLEFEMLLDSSEKISLKIGASILSFKYKEDFKPSHVAFNIPYNAINDALYWLRQRTEVLPYEKSQIIDFPNWKAKAIYFYDNDKNIMELIARERIDIESDVAFSPRAILSISEMAMATESIEDLYTTINNISPIPIFDGNFSRFCAVGNDEGLFILINKNEKKWFPTMEDAYTSDFVIKGDYNFTFENGEIKEIL